MTFALLLATLPTSAAEENGEALFRRTCAVCHDQAPAGGRMPETAALKKRTQTQILQALESGVMQSQGSNLTAAERASIAAWLGVAPATDKSPAASACAPEPAWSPAAGPSGWESWGGNAENWRFQRAGGLAAGDIPKLKLRWAFAVPNAVGMRSQPVVISGRVFLGNQDGSVYALDAKSGCIHWTSKLPGQVRSSLAVARVNSRALLVAGDTTGSLTALDAATGARVWTRRVDEHPFAMITSTPLVHEGKIYTGVSSSEEGQVTSPGYVCCTFRGSFAALNASDGSLLWKTWTIAEPPAPRTKNRQGGQVIGPSGAGIWATPTLDRERNLLYITTGDNYSDPPTDTSDSLLAVDPATGRIVWSKQFTKGDAFNVSCFRPDKTPCPDSAGPDHDFGASAILVKLNSGRRVLLLGQKSGVMHAVDPDRKGEILWQERVGQGGALGGIQWGPATDGDRVYVALSDVLIPGSTGGLFALKVANGERLWQTPNTSCQGQPNCRAAQSAAVTVIPGAVFSGSVDGHLRAYDTATGKVLWDFNAKRDFSTVNGVKGTGGSFDAGGAVIAGGMVFTGSGYGAFGNIPGNVLLAFGVE